MKNTITINGVIYKATFMRGYVPGHSPFPCDICDFIRRCRARYCNPCDAFNSTSTAVYFKKVKSI